MLCCNTLALSMTPRSMVSYLALGLSVLFGCNIPPPVLKNELQNTTFLTRVRWDLKSNQSNPTTPRNNGLPHTRPKARSQNHGLRHEPVNEQGVVLLFGMVAKQLGFLVEAVQKGFPTARPSGRLLPNAGNGSTSNLKLKAGISAITGTLCMAATSLCAGATIGTSAPSTSRPSSFVA